jgi:Kef-type K+ transport system membrane component KefB
MTLTIEALLFSALALTVLAGALGNWSAIRLGQAAVLGELALGMILGNIGNYFHWPLAEQLLDWPAVLDQIINGHRYLTPVSATALSIWTLSQLGILFLLFEVGLETGFSNLRKVGKAASLVAIIGVLLPFTLGFLASMILLSGQSFATGLFVGGTLSATSIAVTARVLRDQNLLRSRAAHVILGAAVIDDFLGLLLVGFLTALVRGGEHGWLNLTVGPIFFCGVVILSFYFLRKSQKQPSYIFALILCLTYSALAAVCGLAGLLGAFAAGMTFSGDENLKKRFLSLFHPLVAFCAPFFFLTVGAQVDLSEFTHIAVVELALVLTIIAILGKLLSGYGAQKEDRWLVGIGMIPRGEVGLIFASLGKSLGLLSTGTFSALVIMVMLTTFIAPIWLNHRHLR